MKYKDIVSATFIERPNRFVARIRLQDGTETLCHVKNTGRCKELLVDDAKVWVEDHAGRMDSRKLRYSLIGVEKKTENGTLMINMDSQAPNVLVKEALENGVINIPGFGAPAVIRPETVHGDSRFDFYLKNSDGLECFAEVKGVTLEHGGVAAFPDAPTERGVKHIEGLIRAKEEGYAAAIIFVIQMEDMQYMIPNDKTHPQFGDALRRAQKAGVSVLAYECSIKPDEVHITRPVDVFPCNASITPL